MAYSRNQNQPALWGPLIFDEDFEVTPRNSLKFWRWAHERVLRIGANLKSKILFLRFDNLCANPEIEVSKLLNFIDAEPNAELVRRATALVKPPDSNRRYQSHPLDQFDPDDVAFVKRLGFEID